jgi:hypothetical protein
MYTKLTPQEMSDNFVKLLEVVDTYIMSPRKDQLKKLYSDHEERLTLMPASTVEHHHNACPGGYVDHVLRVVKCALTLREQWLQNGAKEDYTKEELVFAALNHDLGKMGTEEAEQYLVNESEWHRKNQGKLYTFNPVNAFMTVPDRSLFLLQQRGIQVSFNEYLGIKLHDGLYDDNNKPYYISNSKQSKLRTSLPIVLHHGDHMASYIEYQQWLETQPSYDQKPKSSTKPSNPMSNNDLASIFNNF